MKIMSFKKKEAIILFLNDILLIGISFVLLLLFSK